MVLLLLLMLFLFLFLWRGRNLRRIREEGKASWIGFCLFGFIGFEREREILLGGLI